MPRRQDKYHGPKHDFVDPVCGMAVSRDTAAAEAEYLKKTYFFCSPLCQDRFLSDPEKYVRKSSRSR